MMECVMFKEGVEVELFHNNSNSNSYLLSYKGSHWKVSSFVAYVYEALKETKNSDDAYRLLSDKSKVNVPIEKFNEVICFFENNGLFVGTNDNVKKNTNKNLWGRVTVIPSKIVNKLKILSILFNKKVMVILVIIEIMCFAHFFISYDIQSIITDFWKMDIKELGLCILVIVLFGLVHELGHSTALMSHGQEAGAIGMGVYLYMPVFFSNVTNAWKLKRLQRVCVDIGGIYFQSLSICVVYLLIILIDNDSFIKCAIIISALQIFGNFNPFIKMDGYWMICDILGVSNPYGTILVGIKNLVSKKKRRTEFDDMKTGIKCAFIVYSILIICYFIYLIQLMTMLFVSAVTQIIVDISNIGLLSDMDINFNDVVSFLQTRIILYIVLFFTLRLIIMLFKKIFVFRGKNENSKRF